MAEVAIMISMAAHRPPPARGRSRCATTASMVFDNWTLIWSRWWAEYVHDAVDVWARICVQSPNMRGRFRQSQRSRDRLKVSHLTYQDHVRSAEHRPQGVRERVRSRPSSRWLTMLSCGDGDADRSSIVIMQGRSELMVSIHARDGGLSAAGRTGWISPLCFCTYPAGSAADQVARMWGTWSDRPSAAPTLPRCL